MRTERKLKSHQANELNQHVSGMIASIMIRSESKVMGLGGEDEEYLSMYLAYLDSYDNEVVVHVGMQLL